LGIPRIGITLGDPRGIGPEVIASALAAPAIRQTADFVLIGPEEFLPLEDGAGRGSESPAGFGAVECEAVGAWEPDTGEPDSRERRAGELSGRSIERGVELASRGDIDGLVTGPISKSALSAAGYPFPGHTELLRDRTGVEEVTMMMVAERTPLGGPLRLALLTAHIPLRDVPRALSVELAERRSRIAIGALRDWWGLDRPRVAFAGLNPHASEGGLFGDEEARVLEPAANRLAVDSDAEILGILPADTIFRRAIDGDLDLIVTPYHDVGLAVLKTVARDEGVNVTAGLPFPRTSPDHGTAFDIAGTGTAHPGAMIAAIELCVRFCKAGVTIQ
jgi:4-hydroxythreonine-4-phosphate dehydrogenase